MFTHSYFFKVYFKLIKIDDGGDVSYHYKVSQLYRAKPYFLNIFSFTFKFLSISFYHLLILNFKAFITFILWTVENFKYMFRVIFF
jgi:hypothetical protein